MNADRWMNVLSLLFGAVGILLAIWFYRRGEKKRLPTAVMSPKPSILIHPVFGKFQSFSAAYAGRPIGSNGVTAVHIYFWNNGKLPILHSEVLSPYTASTPAGLKILNATIIKVTRESIGAKVQSDSKVNKDAVSISFTVLEPGDGLTLQLLIDGPEDTEVRFNGSCIGSSKVRVLAPSSNYFASPNERWKNGIKRLSIIVGIASAVSALPWLFVYTATHLKHSPYRSIEAVGFSMFVALFTTASAALLYTWYSDLTAATIPPEIKKW